MHDYDPNNKRFYVTYPNKLREYSMQHYNAHTIFDTSVYSMRYFGVCCVCVCARSWKQASWEPAENIRPVADSFEMNTWYPNVNEEVECQARAEENQPLGWWPCTVQSVTVQVCFNGYSVNIPQ